MESTTTYSSCILLASSFVIMSSGVFAEDARGTSPYLAHDNMVFFGVFVQEGTGNVIAQRRDFEPRSVMLDNLGSDKEYTSWLLEYRRRFNDKWSASVGAYRFNTGNQFAAEQDFNFEGRDFSAGSEIDLYFTMDTYMADVMYTLRGNEHMEWQLGGGLHVFDASLTLTNTLTLDGQELARDKESQSRATLTAPVPNLRTTGFYAFNPKWSIHGTFGWLSADVDRYSGDFFYSNVRVQYQVTERLGLAAGFQHVAADVEEALEKGFNRFDMRFNGVTASLSYMF
jgi:hypothetical protein